MYSTVTFYRVNDHRLYDVIASKKKTQNNWTSDLTGHPIPIKITKNYRINKNFRKCQVTLM